MKKRLLFVLGSLLLVVGVIWLHPGQRAQPVTIKASSAPPPGPNAAEFLKGSSPLKQAPSEPTPAGYGGLADPRWKERREKLLVDDVYEWKKPIDFFGVIVDENQVRVSGAMVNFEWSDTSLRGASSAETISDEKGQFELTGKRGNGLTIRIAKDGYYTPRNIDPARFENTRFWDVHFYEPDAHNPIVFHLRKRGLGEALSEGRMIPTIPADGTPVRFDLLHEGRVSPDGQLEISAATNAETYPPRVFSWRATIAVRGGGLLEYNTEFPFEAPEDGYQPRVDFNMLQGSPNWQHRIDKTYFTQFGAPLKFGRVRVRIDGDSQKVEITYAVNPSGSRNLESTAAEPTSNGR